MLVSDTYVQLCKARMLSPTGQSHTFSDQADGYTRAEGCGVVILKRLDDVRKCTVAWDTSISTQLHIPSCHAWFRNISIYCGGGGGGFFLACEDFWENVRQFIPRLRFFFFFLKWRLACAH